MEFSAMTDLNGFEVICIQYSHELAPWIKEWKEKFNADSSIDSSCSYHRLGGDFLHLSGSDAERSIYILHKKQKIKSIIALNFNQSKLIGPVKLSIASSGEHYVSDMLIMPDVSDNALDLLFTRIFNDHPALTWIDFNRITKPTFNRLVTFTQQKHRPILVDHSSKHLSFITKNITADNFEDSLGKSTRHNMRRYWKRLSNDHGEVTFNVTRPDSLEENNRNFERFLALEASGWKGKEDSAIQSRPMSKRFHKHMTESATLSSQLLWAQLTVNAKAIAMLLIIDRGDKLWVVKTAYNEEYKNYSPGGLLTYKLIHYAIVTPTLNEIDMITEYDWHKRWKPAENQYYSLRLFSTSLKSKLVRKVFVLKDSGWKKEIS
jgi:hypothetical protein